MQVGVVQRVRVGFEDAFEALALRVKDVAVEGETVRGGTGVVDTDSEFATETECRELLVRVVKLKDVADGFQCLIVLVLVQVFAMEGVAVLDPTIT